MVADLQEKIKNLKPETLAFVLDFDGTITKKYVEGVEVPSIISILRSEDILNGEYSKEAFDLKNIYHPIEIDPNVSKEIKFEKMNEWWQKHIDILLQHQLKDTDIEKAAYHPKLTIREGVTNLFTFAKENSIPVIIFSASAIGVESIHFFLERHNIWSPNIIIISNRFEYKDGVAIQRILPIIHALNKNETTLGYFPETQKKILEKKNILLFGDSVNDIEMARNENHDEVIRIGLLNELDAEKKAILLPSFAQKFDLVIEDDGSLEPIYNLLSSDSL